MVRRSLQVSYFDADSVFATFGQTFYIFIAGSGKGDATEATRQCKIRDTLTGRNLFVNVVSNSVNNGSTVSTRVAGAPGGLSVSIPASTAGEYADTTNSDSLVDGNYYNYQIVCGGTSGDIYLGAVSVNLESAGASVVQMVALVTYTAVAEPVTTYGAICGALGNVTTTEANAQYRVRHAAVWDRMKCYVSYNDNKNGGTVQSRINGADGAQSVSITGNTTGEFENGVNSDTLAAGNLICYEITTLAVGGTAYIGIDNIESRLTHSSEQAEVSFGSSAVAANLTRYYALSGRLFANLVEDAVSVDVRGGRFSAKNLYCYVSANTVTAQSNLRLRINGVSGNLNVPITASTTGIFEDQTNRDIIVPVDEIAIMLTTGATGTSLTLTVIGLKLTTTSEEFREGFKLAETASTTVTPGAGPVTLSVADAIIMAESLRKQYGATFSDGLRLAESLKKQYGGHFSDAFMLAETLTKQYGARFSDAFTLAESLTRLYGLRLSDAFLLSEAATTGAGALQTLSLADYFLMAESLARTKAGAYGVSDAFRLAETLQSAKAGGFSLSDALRLADSASSSKGSRFSVSDIFSLAEAISATKASRFSLTDALMLADSFSSAKSGRYSVTDALSLAETITRLYGMRLTDALRLADSLSSAKASRLSVSDAFLLSDQFSTGVGALQTLSLADYFVLTEALSRKLSVAYGISEAFLLGETVSLAKAGSFSLTDAFRLAETLTKQYGARFSDAFRLFDSISLAASRRFSTTDAFRLADSISTAAARGLGISDAYALAERVVRLYGLNVSERFILSESVSTAQSFSLSLVEYMTLSETIRKQYGLNLTDALTLSESLSRLYGMAIREAFQFSDSISSAIGLTLAITDAFILSEAWNYGGVMRTLSVTEAMTFADSFSPFRALSLLIEEGFSLGESLSTLRTIILTVYGPEAATQTLSAGTGVEVLLRIIRSATTDSIGEYLEELINPQSTSASEGEHEEET